MPTPDFVLALRERVGHAPLWMPGVTAVVRNDRGEVLLARRADFGQWGLVSGILEPGEQPAAGLAREIEEETGVVAQIGPLTAVWTLPEVTYPNGDRSQYLDLCFLARYVSGEARVNDDESTEVGWFGVDSLPPDLMERSRVRLERALAYAGTTWFEAPSPPVRGDGDRVAPAPALGSVQLRRARRDDVGAIVALIADDQLGASREDPGDLAAYLAAFDQIDADPHQLLAVADDDGAVVGTLQLSVVPGLARRGARRGQLEAVRVAASHRGRGLGRLMVRWGVEEARSRGCALVQLTTDTSRSDAHRFYEQLGFVASHVGMKLQL